MHSAVHYEIPQGSLRSFADAPSGIGTETEPGNEKMQKRTSQVGFLCRWRSNSVRQCSRAVREPRGVWHMMGQRSRKMSGIDHARGFHDGNGT